MAALIRRGRIESLLSPETRKPDSTGIDAVEAGMAEAGTGQVLRLEPADDPAKYADRLGAVARIDVNFPSFTDGRGYSIARLLRERHGYDGELRAVGDVQRDQLFYLARCGFDAFLLRKDADAEDALAAFNDFSEAYQASVERPQPLFRRR
jgi:uncharacterized protein (DUF934 family)